MSYGLDIYIEKAITVLTAHLWVGYNNSFLGRSYRLKKNGKIRPEIYDETAQNKSSKEVFFTDKYDSIVHFDVEPSNPMISQLQKTSTVNIFFAVNLGTIYGNETRAVERAQNDIFKVLQYTSFTVVDFVDQIEAYTDVYDMDEKEQLKYNMQPYYVIRVETEIMAALGTCTPIIRAVNYGLTLSHTGNGIMFVDGVQAVDSRLSKAAGSTVTFAATPDEDNEFTSWVIDGTTYTYPTPTIDSMDGAKSALATFQLIPYYQELLRGILTDYVKIGDINKLENYGSGLNAGRNIIHNTQVITFDGSSYLIFTNINTITIVSSEGTSIPTKINGIRIDFTAGTCWNLKLSNGSILPLIEGQGINCYDTLGIHDATIILPHVALWDNKSDAASPELLIKGGNPTLVCETAGVSATLADPSGENIGENNIYNGDFKLGSTGWNIASLTNGTFTENVLRCTNASGFITNKSLNTPNVVAGVTYFYRIKLSNVAAGKMRITSEGGSGTFYAEGDGLHVGILTAAIDGATWLIPTNSFTGDVEYFERHEIISIDLSLQENTWEFGINSDVITNSFKIIFISSNTIGYTEVNDGNKYILTAWTDKKVYFVKRSGGTTTVLFSTVVDYLLPDIDYKVKVIRSINGIFTFYIKGGSFGNIYILMSVDNGINPVTDNEITETTYFLADNSVGDKVLGAKKNDIYFNPNNFSDQTGIYGTRYIFGIDDDNDVDGNELIYKPNNGLWNNNNTIQYPDIDDFNSLFRIFDELNDLAYPAKIDSEEFKAIDLTEIPSKLFNFTLNEKTHSITDLVADFNFPNQTINNSLIATFITKYASQSVDLNNQLNILMIGNSIFGRMGIDEITSSPGESTGLFPPNMWQQLVAYGLLESLQFSGADVVYKNLMHSDWTQSGTWVASDPTTENLRLYESTTIGDLVEITITGASFFKLLFYTAGNTDIDVLINGSLPSVLGITGSDSFNGGTIAAGGFFKWANEIYSGLTPATSYTFRFTNTNGSSFQVWGCEYWSGKRINVINQGYGGYKAGNILANINQWSSEMYNADLIINELPLINDSYDYTHYLGEKFPASTAVSSSTNDFIQAAMSGVFTNYSGLTLDIGDYAQYNGAAWVKGSAYVDNIIDTYITDLTAYLEIASTINKEIIIISPHRTTSEPIRAWMCEMLKQATIIINSYGFGFIDFSMRYDILDYDIASAVSDGTHLNDVGVARWVDLLNELL